jgi:hypothetical protein
MNNLPIDSLSSAQSSSFESCQAVLDGLLADVRSLQNSDDMQVDDSSTSPIIVVYLLHLICILDYFFLSYIVFVSFLKKDKSLKDEDLKKLTGVVKNFQAALKSKVCEYLLFIYYHIFC